MADVQVKMLKDLGGQWPAKGQSCSVSEERALFLTKAKMAEAVESDPSAESEPPVDPDEPEPSA